MTKTILQYAEANVKGNVMTLTQGVDNAPKAKLYINWGSEVPSIERLYFEDSLEPEIYHEIDLFFNLTKDRESSTANLVITHETE